MLEHLTNDGIAILNPTPSPDGCATIIVVGVARSGTSMLGAALEALDVHLGNTDKAVFEDIEVAKAIEGKDQEALATIIASRNDEFRIWGFKRPEAFILLPDVLPLFRNPRIIMTFRDPVAIARRNEISIEADFLAMLRRSITRTTELVEFAGKLTCPTMLVSYEKAIARPADFIESMASFCGLVVSDEQKRHAAKSIQNGPAIYLTSSRVWTEGFFEGVREDVARGWARKMPMCSICEIEIWADGEKIASGRADQARSDLDGKIGAHAFAIPIKDIGDRVVEARVRGSNVVLRAAKGPL